MFRRCAVCGLVLAEDAVECPGCGVDEANLISCRIVLVTDGTGFRYRVLELPLEMTRDWFKTFFMDVQDSDGNPVHRYVAPGRTAGVVERSEVGRPAIRGCGPVTDGGNELRVNGEQLGREVRELRRGMKIELWSAARDEAVLRLRVEFEEFVG